MSDFFFAVSDCDVFSIFISAYQSTFMDDEAPAKAPTALLLLFREHENSPTMINCAIMLIKQQAEYFKSISIGLQLIHCSSTLQLFKCLVLQSQAFSEKFVFVS